MTAGQKRVLLTTSPTYHKVPRRAFETGGCNMAVPGQPLLVKILGMEGNDEKDEEAEENGEKDEEDEYHDEKDK